MEDFGLARTQMVELQLRARDIGDARVLEAMARVPRHLFVASELSGQAYEDCPLPIGAGQTISQPYMVARMLELLRLGGDERVLEVGAGSGYVAALLGLLARDVFAVEILAPHCEQARARMKDMGVENVQVDCRDGTQGWPEAAPYRGILVSAGAPRVPPMLIDQLADGGRLVVPVGERGYQTLMCIQRRGDHYDTVEDVGCRFVDLMGRHGWEGPGVPQA